MYSELAQEYSLSLVAVVGIVISSRDFDTIHSVVLAFLSLHFVVDSTTDSAATSESTSLLRWISSAVSANTSVTYQIET